MDNPLSRWLGAQELAWAGIAICLVQSALFSGLNLALLGVSRLQLDVETASGSKEAARILELREDSNFLLTTILWGNVATNCLLTLLSDSVLFGAGAFLFSTFGITIVGEILPQAYFSRNAIRIGARLTPFIKTYQRILYPVARPTARILDRWLGAEEVNYFREHELREVIRQHMAAESADLAKQEGLGVLNFLVMDDLPIGREGESIDPASIITLPVRLDLPVFPDLSAAGAQEFLGRVNASGQKWVIVTDEGDVPRVALDADGFLRDALLTESPVDPYRYCHRPLVVDDPTVPLGSLIRKLHVDPINRQDDVIDHDVILLWGEERKIVTGADVLGRIMRGIVARRRGTPSAAAEPEPAA